MRFGPARSGAGVSSRSKLRTAGAAGQRKCSSRPAERGAAAALHGIGTRPDPTGHRDGSRRRRPPDPDGRHAIDRAPGPHRAAPGAGVGWLSADGRSAASLCETGGAAANAARVPCDALRCRPMRRLRRAGRPTVAASTVSARRACQRCAWSARPGSEHPRPRLQRHAPRLGGITNPGGFPGRRVATRIRAAAASPFGLSEPASGSEWPVVPGAGRLPARHRDGSRYGT